MLVHLVSRFSSDIRTLTILIKSYTPTLIPVIPKDIKTAVYEFVNSAWSGYGISLKLPQTK